MANQDFSTYSQSQPSLLASNAVLRNTYMLLSLTLLFSAAMAGISMMLNVQMFSPFLVLIVNMGLLIATVKCRNSGWGIVLTFAFTGFMGFTLGPILNFYTNNIAGGSSLIMQALGGTGLIFVSLSAYTLTTRKCFSFLGNFLFIGFIVALFAIVANLFLHIPALQITLSAVFMVLSSMLILYRTSQIVNGGETNYVMATIDLYVAIYNLFLSLLQILSFFSGDRS